jgi:single-stranded DNA-binding protein
LTKGKKVCVVGPVSVSTFTGNDGTTRATLEVTADDVEFLSPRAEGITQQPVNSAKMEQVDIDELPWEVR